MEPARGDLGGGWPPPPPPAAAIAAGSFTLPGLLSGGSNVGVLLPVSELGGDTGKLLPLPSAAHTLTPHTHTHIYVRTDNIREHAQRPEENEREALVSASSSSSCIL